MNWTCLWNAFLQGNTDAVQAVFSILGFFVAIIGTVFVVASFRNQNQINKVQRELNILAMEDNKRSIKPIFIIENIEKTSQESMQFDLKLANAVALKVRFVMFDIEYSTVRGLNYWPIGKPPLKLKAKLESPYEQMVVVYQFYVEDETGRKYLQEIYTKNRGIFISYPKPLDSNFQFPDTTLDNDY